MWYIYQKEHILLNYLILYFNFNNMGRRHQVVVWWLSFFLPLWLAGTEPWVQFTEPNSVTCHYTPVIVVLRHREEDPNIKNIPSYVQLLVLRQLRQTWDLSILWNFVVYMGIFMLHFVINFSIFNQKPVSNIKNKSVIISIEKISKSSSKDMWYIEENMWPFRKDFDHYINL